MSTVQKQRLLQSVNLRSSMMLIILAFVCVMFTLLTNGLFFSPRNITLLLRQATILGTLSLGAVLTVVTGNFDISVGSVVALMASIAAILDVFQGWNVAPIIVVVLAAGAICGVWNGFLVARLNIPSFIATLGGMMLFRGLVLIVSKGYTIGTMSAEFQVIANSFLPKNLSAVILVIVAGLLIYAQVTRMRKMAKSGMGVPFRRLILNLLLSLAGVMIMFYATYYYRGLPLPIVVLAFLTFVLHIVMTRTKFGRSIYATGGNREAAELAGIQTRRTIFLAFVIMGVLAGISGILMASRLAAAPPNAGAGLEMDAIAAAVIGGTSITGGVGSIPGAIIGALVLASIDNGMSIMNVSGFIQFVIKGLVLVGAVALDVKMKR